MKLKKYWIRDLRTDKELVLTAYNLKEVSTKTGIPKDRIQVCRTWWNKNIKPSELILAH